MTGSQTTPQSEEAELGILAGILNCPDSGGPAAMRLLEAADFFGDDRRKIFSKLVHLELQGQPVNDALLLLDSLSPQEKSGLAPLIASLLSPMYKSDNLEKYAQIIKTKATVRQNMALCESMTEKLAAANGDASQVLAEVSDLSARLENRTSPRVVVAEDINLPDMPDLALDGRLGEICQTRLGDFPLAYALPALLTAAGVLVRHTHNVLRTTLYTGLVGPPGSGKSQAIDRAIFLMDLKPPSLAEVKSGSVEGFLKDQGDQQGVPVLLSPDELSHLLEKAQIVNASFAYILNTIFYKDEAHLTIAHGAKVNFNRPLSIVGGIVGEKFEDGFGGATTGGLYDRFFFGQCPTGINEYLYRPREGRPAFEDQVDECRVNHDVWEARDEIARKEKLNPRLLEIALRTAAICAAFDGRDELRARDLGPAWELARYQARVRLLLKPNVGKNFEAQVAAKILNYLNRHAPDGGWMVQRQVLNATNANDFGPSVVNRALDAMAFSGSIGRSEEPAGRGQKRRLVRLAVETPKPTAAETPNRSGEVPRAQIPTGPAEIDDSGIPF